MRPGQRASVLLLVLPLLLGRIPSSSPGRDGLALLLALVVVANALVGPGRRWIRLRHAVGLAAFFGLLLVPPAGSAWMGGVPAWSAGPIAVAYVAFYFMPRAAAAPRIGAARSAVNIALVLRWVPVVAVLGALVAASITVAAWFPPPLSRSWEFGGILLVLAAAAWLAALCVLVSALRSALRQDAAVAPPPSVPMPPTSNEATA